jgi:hypothetical protein
MRSKRATRLQSVVVKSDNHIQGAKPRRRRSRGEKGRPRAALIGTRPLKFPMTLRGQRVEVKVIPVVSTTTHLNFEVTITRQGEALDWVPTRAERARIGRAAGMHAVLETSH